MSSLPLGSLARTLVTEARSSYRATVPMTIARHDHPHGFTYRYISTHSQFSIRDRDKFQILTHIRKMPRSQILSRHDNWRVAPCDTTNSP
jgi:hypothetical protein